jgi:thiamine biosynthesis protein ThiS
MTSSRRDAPAGAQITISVNGKPRALSPGTALTALLDELGVDRRTIAVAHNEQVIPRDAYDGVLLADGDRVEIVRMVGGG